MEEKCVLEERTKRVSFSSQEFLIPEEIYEEIMVRLDVKNLIRGKSVCKSWKSFISRPHFIKAHHCFNNNDNGQTKISQAVIVPIFAWDKGPDQNYCIVGSAKGLVCVHSFCGKEFIVANPWTRQENMVQVQQQPLGSKLSCLGFGYDRLTDDYKIVFGVEEEGMNRTSFQVFSLKSNVWKHIGCINYSCDSAEIATLCNEALHWRMFHTGQNKPTIISFDLSKEVFTEIPQPDDPRYGPNKKSFRLPISLGIKDGCLCISYRESNLWIMRKYNVKESWVKSGSDFELKYEVLDLDQFRYGVKDKVENDVSDIPRSDHDTWFLNKCKCVPNITVMQSLISPHPSRQ